MALFLLLLFPGATGRLLAQVPEKPDEDFVISSVMIASPGDALYSKLGHAFIRMQCPSHDMDFCFTYESDDVVHKVPAFLAGDLKMGMMGIPTGEFLENYRKEGREVTEYTLDLPVAVKQNMWRILDRYVDEGMLLPDDYMERGCAYAVYKVLMEAAGPGKITFDGWTEDFSMTRREMVCSQLNESPWTKLFLNIITNGPIDNQVSNYEKIITPKHLVQSLQHARYDGHPILKGNATTVMTLRNQPPEAPWITPMLIAALFLVCATACAAFGKPWILYILLGVQTLMGLFVAYLLFFSSLCATEWSWLIIPFNPLPVIFWKWRKYWEAPYAAIILLWVLLITFCGSYLMDPPIILLALSFGIAIMGDELRRRNVFFKLHIKNCITNKPKQMLMKKTIFILFMVFVGLTAFRAEANDVGNFYVTCKVKVADDSNGRGKVYIDASEGQVDEATKSMPNQMPAVESRDIEFTIITTPSPGYVFANFTDQYGNPHYYQDQSSHTVVLTGTSEDINNPTFYELSAHFVPEGDLPAEEFVEVTIPANSKFGTFIAPVSAELPEGLVAYKVVGVEEGAVVLEDHDDTTVPAFTAVLLENTGVFDESVTTSYNKVQLPDPLPSLTTGLLTGTLEDLEVGIGNYILNAGGEESTFEKLTDEVGIIDAYTCYMSVEEGENSYTVSAENTNGIESIINTEEYTEIYDLEGRRLNNLRKGINIVNGVKVIVR